MARGLIREALRLRWIRTHPASYWRYYEWKRGLAEPEIALLPRLCERDGLSVDVGANIGLYTWPLLKHSGRCMAFEPLPDMACLLRSAFGRVGERFRLEEVALSDQRGSAELRMPERSFGYSTIEPENELSGKVASRRVRTFQVETRLLDEYELDDLCFLKVDVEGHEDRVLRGGVETLKRCRPSVLVEVEERHKAGSVARVHEFMRELGYQCFFVEAARLRPIADFELDRHQDESDPDHYVRNFLFLDEAVREDLEALLRAAR